MLSMPHESVTPCMRLLYHLDNQHMPYLQALWDPLLCSSWALMPWHLLKGVAKKSEVTTVPSMKQAKQARATRSVISLIQHVKRDVFLLRQEQPPLTLAFHTLEEFLRSDSHRALV